MSIMNVHVQVESGQHLFRNMWTGSGEEIVIIGSLLLDPILSTVGDKGRT